MFPEYDDTQAYNDLVDCKKHIAELEVEITRLLLDIEFRKEVTSQLVEQRDAALAVVRQLRDELKNYEYEPVSSALAAAARLLGEI